MAGRGRAATIPAWMSAVPHAGFAPAAPGAPPAMAFPPPPTGAGAPSFASASFSDPASAWTEHTAPDGRRKYWHNAATGRSTYEKPHCLMTATERADATTRWKEAVAPDGRSYFHHLDTKETKWRVPEEVRVAREAAFLAEGAALAKAAQHRALPASLASAEGAPERGGDSETDLGMARRRTDPRGEASALAYASPEEALESFFQCLADCGVTSAHRWDEATRLCASDPRFLGALRTPGERKKRFHEYRARRQKTDRETKRADEKRKRNEFTRMLLEAAETLGCGAPGFSFREVAEDLAKDARYAERFKAVADDREKEDLYRAHCEDLRAGERRATIRKRDDEKRAFLERLVASKFKGRWRDVRDDGFETETNPQTHEYHGCDRYDRLVAFETFALEEEARDERGRALRETAGRLEEKKNRNAFTAFLEKKRLEGKIQPRVPWRDFVREERLDEEDAYVRVSGNRSGSRPRELYEDQLEILERRAETARAAATEALAAAGIVLTDLVEPIEPLEGGAGVSVSVTDARAVQAAILANPEARTAVSEAWREPGDSAPDGRRLEFLARVAAGDIAADAERRRRALARRRREANDGFRDRDRNGDGDRDGDGDRKRKRTASRDVLGFESRGSMKRGDARVKPFFERDGEDRAAEARRTGSVSVSVSSRGGGSHEEDDEELEEGEAPDPKRGW